MGRLARFIHFYTDEDDGADVGPTNIVSGNPPLSLVNAIAKKIRHLIQYGKCTVSGTDITCNNGVLTKVHRSGLPSGYTLLEYVGGSGTQYVVTDIYLASTDVVECEYRNSSATGYGAVYGIYKTGESTALYGNKTYYGYTSANNKVDTEVSVNTDWHSSRHDFVNGSLTVDDTTVTFTPWTFTNDTKNAVLSRYYNGSYGYNWNGYIRKFKVTRGNAVICDLIPCKNDQNVAGFYDIANSKFYAPTGGSLLEGNEVDDYELAVEGTPEEISVTASGADDQTATASNLFAVGSITDEQDIISGTITRRCEAVVSDGTTPSGRYIGTVGEGNIIVQTKETGYSGAIASFTADKAEPLSGLVAQINPVQDLHGYDAPWPAGGWVNLLPPMVDGTYTGNGVTVVVKDGVATMSGTSTQSGNAVFIPLAEEFTVPNGAFMHMLNSVANGSVPPSFELSSSPGTTAVAVSLSPVNRIMPVDSEHYGKKWDRVRFYLAANVTLSGTFAPMVCLDSTVRPYSPYSNECPISGWTGLEGQRTGVNVFGGEALANVIMEKVEGATIDTVNKTVTFTASKIQNIVLFDKFKPNTQYTIFCKNTGATNIDLVYTDGVKVGLTSNGVTVSNQAKNVFGLVGSWHTGNTTLYYEDFGIIEGALTADDFTPYTGEPISVSWQDEAGTVYGGQDEVIGGNGTSTMGIITLDGTQSISIVNWRASSTSVGWVYPYSLTNNKVETVDSNMPNVVCDSLPTITYANAFSMSKDIGITTLASSTGASSYGLVVRINDPTLTTASAINAYLSAHPITVIYELATPQSFTHDPQQIETLVGQNNVWVDTGDVTAYVPDFTTEQVAGQSLSTTDGTNTVFVTSNVDPVELEVEYRTP